MPETKNMVLSISAVATQSPLKQNADEMINGTTIMPPTMVK
jgi:hypothetical protein